MIDRNHPAWDDYRANDERSHWGFTHKLTGLEPWERQYYVKQHQIPEEQEDARGLPAQDPKSTE